MCLSWNSIKITNDRSNFYRKRNNDFYVYFYAIKLHNVVKIKILLFILAGIFFSCKNEKSNTHINHTQYKQTNLNKKGLSKKTYALSMFGVAHGHIDYSSPKVRGRIIFGGLLPFNEVWQSGAHMATSIDTNKKLMINNQILDEGKYAIFTIPSKKNWTFIINKNWQQHGKDDYNPKDDVIRFIVKPINLDNLVEELRYEVKKTENKKGEINLIWERVKISFPFTII